MQNIEILYEDDCLLLINKPENLIVHQSKFGGEIDEFSLCQILNKQLNQTVHPIHRLDRKTSGIILFAKDKTIIPVLQKQFENQSIEKEYIALVRGYVTDSGIIDSPIKPEEKTEYKSALTYYKPIDIIEIDIPVIPYSSSRYTVVQLVPKTGRTHQLRKHMNKISHPIIGDPKFGNRHHNHMFIEEFGIPNLFLHARRLTFTHPKTSQELTFIAAFPSFWDVFFKATNWEPSL